VSQPSHTQPPTIHPSPLPYATPPNFSSSPAPAAAPLSPEHLQQIQLAQKRAGKIKRAILVAQFDGWATGIFGGITVLGVLFGSIVAFLLGGGMLIVSFVEFRGVKKLRRLEPDATRWLGWNQVFFGSILLLYAAWSLWGVYHEQSDLAKQLAGMPDMGAMGRDIDQITRTIGLMVYGGLAAVAIFGQGGTALYYWSRRKFVEAYLNETPKWIIDAQRAGLPM
jgi:MFS family permease